MAKPVSQSRGSPLPVRSTCSRAPGTVTVVVAVLMADSSCDCVTGLAEQVYPRTEVAVAKPLWRRAFDTAEQAAAPHLERGVQSGAFTDVVVLAQRARTGVYRKLERDSRRVWHLLNLPAGSDVRRLRRQVASLDREVRLLRDLLQEQREERP